ncbi:unnamed protein product [Brassica napus]|uniref:(rape) hypothetical protein n=1 Tax=Brassica napus TaxID=3708 RepID=A0A816IWS1_BRANA|nr:unnamed protein product [Brassica napus]
MVMKGKQVQGMSARQLHFLFLKMESSPMRRKLFSSLSAGQRRKRRSLETIESSMTK